MFDSDDFDDIPFEELVKKYNMVPVVSIELDDYDILVYEKWMSNGYYDVVADRYYYFDIYFMELLPVDIRIKTLNDILNVYVENEMYEEAAIVRDEIKKL